MRREEKRRDNESDGTCSRAAVTASLSLTGTSGTVPIHNTLMNGYWREMWSGFLANRALSSQLYQAHQKTNREAGIREAGIREAGIREARIREEKRLQEKRLEEKKRGYIRGRCVAIRWREEVIREEKDTCRYKIRFDP